MQNKAKLIKERIGDLRKRLERCDICPRDCHVNRLKGQAGFCKASSDIVVYAAFIHKGEEPVISGICGSGTIFFSGCNLQCIYCQNYKFSHTLKGKVLSSEGLADLMLKLQRENAHNINLVTPTHLLPFILDALQVAISNGLNIPIVYNTSGYEKKEILELLSGIIDIYLPDMKYSQPDIANICSFASDYSFYNRQAIEEMYRQKKENLFDGDILKSGMIIRHLVIPGYIQQTGEILSWIKRNLPGCLTSIMFQYQPYHKAHLCPSINRTISNDEYMQVKKMVEHFDLDGWIQDFRQDEGLAGIHFNPNI